MLCSRQHYCGDIHNTACFYREFGYLPIKELQVERRTFFLSAPCPNWQCDYDNVRKEVK